MMPSFAVSPFVIAVESSPAAAACLRLCDLVGGCRCFEFCLSVLLPVDARCALPVELSGCGSITMGRIFTRLYLKNNR